MRAEWPAEPYDFTGAVLRVFAWIFLCAASGAALFTVFIDGLPT